MSVDYINECKNPACPVSSYWGSLGMGTRCPVCDTEPGYRPTTITFDLDPSQVQEFSELLDEFNRRPES